MNERILYKLDKIILVLIFGLAIYVPLFVGVIQEDKINSSVEKRTLNQFPAIPKSIQDVSKYPPIFNLYYSDHFGFRDFFTKVYFKLSNKIFSPSSRDVTVGQNGWLFLGSLRPGYSRYDDPMGDAINKNLFSKKELEDFTKSILTIKNWLKEKGIEYIYVIAPNKHTIYFDNLPKYISKQNETSATDQLVKYLQEHTDIIVIDLRDILLEEKKKHQVYFMSDTHWNHYGANVVQFEIMKKIKSLFPDRISPSALNDNQFKILKKNNGDLAKFAQIENFIENDPQPVFKGTCSPVKEPPNPKSRETFTSVCKTQKLKALIFRDSFFTALEPYFSRHFYHSTYIWEKINYESLSRYVESDQPDIVIDEIVERSLPYIPSSIKNF